MAQEQKPKPEQEKHERQEQIDKIKFSIKQSAKGSKYFDITVRGNTIKDIQKLYEPLEKYAFEKGCLRPDEIPNEIKG